jgi:hypothetical protein
MMKFVAPSPSYEIPLPDDIVADYEERVTSYWKNGGHVLLQLSSTVRGEGTQVAAAQRLEELFQRNPSNWSTFELNLDAFPGDLAGAQMNDDHGTKWIHIYLTTANIAIYAIVSGPPGELVMSTWAFDAIRNLRIKSSSTAPSS